MTENDFPFAFDLQSIKNTVLGSSVANSKLLKNIEIVYQDLSLNALDLSIDHSSQIGFIVDSSYT